MTTYNINQLKQYANKFLNDNYGMTLDIPLQINGRLKRTCGWFRYKIGNGTKKAVAVELNRYFVENNEPTIVLDVLRHELIHYALFKQDKPHSDGHPVFENELSRLGVVSQDTINKYEIKSKPINISVYKCSNQDCGVIFKRKRALPNNGKNHRCGSCKSNLIDMGKRKLVKS